MNQTFSKCLLIALGLTLTAGAANAGEVNLRVSDLARDRLDTWTCWAQVRKSNFDRDRSDRRDRPANGCLYAETRVEGFGRDERIAMRWSYAESERCNYYRDSRGDIRFDDQFFDSTDPTRRNSIVAYGPNSRETPHLVIRASKSSLTIKEVYGSNDRDWNSGWENSNQWGPGRPTDRDQYVTLAGIRDESMIRELTNRWSDVWGSTPDNVIVTATDRGRITAIRIDNMQCATRGPRR